MKLNLLRNSNDIISGYVNIDPFATDDRVQVGDVENLDYVADDAQCQELVARDIIDYIAPDKIDGVLSGWIKKLRHGGKITVGGTDLFMVSRAFSSGDIDGNLATSLIFGPRTDSASYKKNLSTLNNVANFLETNGLNIILKKYDKGTMKYIVTAERP